MFSRRAGVGTARRPGFRGVGGGIALLPASGAYFWLEDQVTLNGATVASWLDKSGNGRNWTQASAPLQPTYVASAINGRPGLSFSAAATQYLSGASLAALTAAEVFYVLQLNADPPATAAKSALSRFGTSASIDNVPFTDGVIYDGAFSTARKTTGNPTPSLASPRIYSVVSIANEWTSYIDGVQFFTTATNTFGGQSSPYIGATPGSNYLDGLLCAVIVYSAKLSAADRATTIAYLKSRYGIA